MNPHSFLYLGVYNLSYGKCQVKRFMVPITPNPLILKKFSLKNLRLGGNTYKIRTCHLWYTVTNVWC